jgi:23S rRNA pseudouridine1911/1915/1917 synthase
MVGLAPTQICFVIRAEDDGTRLDKILAQNAPEISRARLQALVKSGACAVKRNTIRNNRADTIKDPAWRVKPDDEIALTVPPPAETAITGENIALDILHEDDQLIVLNKPAGMVVHPAPGNREATLVNALIAHCGDTLSGIGGEKRPGIVHRLDKDTSGVMVAAKTDAAHLSLSAQFAAHGRDGRMQRSYQALVWGTPLPGLGKVDAPLARAPHNRRKMAVSTHESARHAVTHYQVQESFLDGQVTRLACHLETGRTHQIRVHMAHIGHPVLGDPLYGAGMKSRTSHLDDAATAALEALARQALHAQVLGFEHPATGARMDFEAPLPADMAHLLATLAPA